MAMLALALFVLPALACNGCPESGTTTQTRLVRRAQPDAQSAATRPRAPLRWGAFNVLHTTDTHGWLEGHLKEPSYGADWGDFVSFVAHMRGEADHLGVDLLVVDSGDLHDGSGLSDVTALNGAVSNPVFENVDFDLLTIGNHELYVSDIAYDHFYRFAKVFGDRYLTSNVRIKTPNGDYQYIGKQYRYFTTKNGLRIMAFGVLFDFTRNSNATKITMAADMVKENWFQAAVNYAEPIDMFLVLGHNPPGRPGQDSTFPVVFEAIRAVKPDIPITMFGGHGHTRDTVVYDNKAVCISSGRYCETLGWLSMSGFRADKPNTPGGPDKPAMALPGGPTAHLSRSMSPSNLTYSRRYLDWNRATFEYHAPGSQSASFAFDTPHGTAVTREITGARKRLNLTTLIGCAPRTYCISCRPFGDAGNIYTGLLAHAVAYAVVNVTRAAVPRLIVLNTGSIRFDLPEGPFTYDDSFIVSPYFDEFQFLADVPYASASKVLGILNAGRKQKKKRSLQREDFGFEPILGQNVEPCPNPMRPELSRRSLGAGMPLVKRETAVTPGYTTTDDFGIDGDDTVHAEIPNHPQPNGFQANASFPTDGSTPATVDLVFVDYVAPHILAALGRLGEKYATKHVQYYTPANFTTNSYLPIYAKAKWSAGLPNCPAGKGIGS